MQLLINSVSHTSCGGALLFWGGIKNERKSERENEDYRVTHSVKEDHGGVMNQRGVDQGWSGVVERGWCRRKRACLTSNSSHREKLMEGGRRFCTYPDSPPPHSIIRQSIMSTKKEEEEEKKVDRHSQLVQECGCSSLLLLSQSVGSVKSWFRVDLFSPNNLFRGHVAGAVCSSCRRWWKCHYCEQNSWEISPSLYFDEAKC